MSFLIRAIIFASTIAIAPGVYAQYASAEEVQAQQAELKKLAKQKESDAQRAFIGSKFWIEPNPLAKSRVRFYSLDPEDQSRGFVLTEPSSFVVNDIVKTKEKRFARDLAIITFADGMQARLEINPSFGYAPQLKYMFENVLTLADIKTTRSEAIEYILAASPLEFSKAERKAAAAAAAWRQEVECELE